MRLAVFDHTRAVTLMFGPQPVRMLARDMPVVSWTSIDVTSELARVLTVDSVSCPNGHRFPVLDPERLPDGILTTYHRGEEHWCDLCGEHHADKQPARYVCGVCDTVMTVPWEAAPMYTRQVPGQMTITPLSVTPRPRDLNRIRHASTHPLTAWSVIPTLGARNILTAPIPLGEWHLTGQVWSSDEADRWELNAVSDPTEGLRALGQKLKEA